MDVAPTIPGPDLGTVPGVVPGVVPGPVVGVGTLRVRGGAGAAGERRLPEETPVAFSFNRVSHAVMMATPADLEDFALGFSLTEGVVARAEEIEELEVVAPGRPGVAGVELRMWVSAAAAARLDGRRRVLAGPTGCGLCGLDSLEQAVREPPGVPPGVAVPAGEIAGALRAMHAEQALNRDTRAVHAAALWRVGHGPVAVREDVGRHNALDKLAGAAARAGAGAGTAAAAGCVAVMTSRVSVELVQKAARMGVPVLVAVSAPTALALRVAERAGMTVVGVAREDGFEVFTNPGRIVL